METDSINKIKLRTILIKHNNIIKTTLLEGAIIQTAYIQEEEDNKMVETKIHKEYYHMKQNKITE